jgi:hypothetical protein
MNTPTLLQFPTGDEATLDEWKEAQDQPDPDSTDEPDKFIRWEAERSLMKTIGDLVAHEKGLNATGKSELFRAFMPNRRITLKHAVASTQGHEDT